MFTNQFFDFLQKFDLLVISGVCVAIIVFAIKRLVQFLNRRLKIQRGRRMVAVAVKSGPILYYNQINSTEAVCLVRDYKLQEFSRANTPTHSFWEPSGELRVRPTFLFCGANALRTKMHVQASREEGRVIAEDLISKVTGYHKGQVDKRSWSMAAENLVQKNPKLFVPFSQKLEQEEAKRQADFYGTGSSLADVRQYILDSTD
ncbi:MAG: hypothetical protein V4473_02425 [Patescibacteria group bacterium]